MVDLDGDGIKDIITGSWPGEVFLFRGKGNGQFAPKEKVLGKDGLPINISGGVKETDDEIWITGDAEFKGDGDDQEVIYNGKTYKQTEKKQLMVTGCASAVFVADWNGDGLLDLIAGEIEGKVGVYINSGTAKKPVYDKPQFLKAGSKEIRVPHGDAGPVVADWDGDGVPDLIVGAGDGSVQFFRNEGTGKEPKLARGVALIPAGFGLGDDQVPTVPKRGTRAKVCVADWNGDGKLDLLVGDYTTQKPEPKKLTEEEKKKLADAKARYDVVMKDFREHINKLSGPSRLKDREELKKATERFKTIQKEMMELVKIIPHESESHGWVWYFERKEIAGGTEGAK